MHNIAYILCFRSVLSQYYCSKLFNYSQYIESKFTYPIKYEGNSYLDFLFFKRKSTIPFILFNSFLIPIISYNENNMKININVPDSI